MAEAQRHGAGGIAGLSEFLRRYGEAVEWDMARYWPGRSLLELYRGTLSWRELRVFLAHLPPDSATARAVNPRSAEEEFWTPERHLIATVADAVREGTYAQVKLHGDPTKTKRLRPPDPIPRPGVKSRRTGGGDGGSTVIRARFGGRNPSAAAELAAAFGGPANRQ